MSHPVISHIFRADTNHHFLQLNMPLRKVTEFAIGDPVRVMEVNENTFLILRVANNALKQNDVHVGTNFRVNLGCSTEYDIMFGRRSGSLPLDIAGKGFFLFSSYPTNVYTEKGIALLPTLPELIQQARFVD